MFIGVSVLLGAFVFRMRGGMKPSFPRPVDQALFVLPYAVLTGIECGVIAAAIVWAVSTAAVTMGHANNQDLGDFDTSPERYEFVTRWFLPDAPVYWRDFAGLCMSGFLYTLPAGIALMDPFLALSGMLKGPAYALGKRAGAGTMGGELLTGAALWAVCAYSILKAF